MTKTPFSLLLSGLVIALLGIGALAADFHFGNGGKLWDWLLILLGIALMTAAFIWVKNLSLETRRKLMVYSPMARRLFWPFAKDLQFSAGESALDEVEKLKDQKKTGGEKT